MINIIDKLQNRDFDVFESYSILRKLSTIDELERWARTVPPMEAEEEQGWKSARGRVLQISKNSATPEDAADSIRNIIEMVPGPQNPRDKGRLRGLNEALDALSKGTYTGTTQAVPNVPPSSTTVLPPTGDSGTTYSPGGSGSQIPNDLGIGTTRMSSISKEENEIYHKNLEWREASDEKILSLLTDTLEDENIYTKYLGDKDNDFYWVPPGGEIIGDYAEFPSHRHVIRALRNHGFTFDEETFKGGYYYPERGLEIVTSILKSSDMITDNNFDIFLIGLKQVLADNGIEAKTENLTVSDQPIDDIQCKYMILPSSETVIFWTSIQATDNEGKPVYSVPYHSHMYETFERFNFDLTDIIWGYYSNWRANPVPTVTTEDDLNEKQLNLLSKHFPNCQYVDLYDNLIEINPVTISSYKPSLPPSLLLYEKLSSLLPEGNPLPELGQKFNRDTMRYEPFFYDGPTGTHNKFLTGTDGGLYCWEVDEDLKPAHMAARKMLLSKGIDTNMAGEIAPWDVHGVEGSAGYPVFHTIVDDPWELDYIREMFPTLDYVVDYDRWYPLRQEVVAYGKVDQIDDSTFVSELSPNLKYRLVGDKNNIWIWILDSFNKDILSPMHSDVIQYLNNNNILLDEDSFFYGYVQNGHVYIMDTGIDTSEAEQQIYNLIKTSRDLSSLPPTFNTRALFDLSKYVDLHGEEINWDSFRMSSTATDEDIGSLLEVLTEVGIAQTTDRNQIGGKFRVDNLQLKDLLKPSEDNSGITPLEHSKEPVRKAESSLRKDSKEKEYDKLVFVDSIDPNEYYRVMGDKNRIYVWSLNISEEAEEAEEAGIKVNWTHIEAHDIIVQNYNFDEDSFFMGYVKRGNIYLFIIGATNLNEEEEVELNNRYKDYLQSIISPEHSKESAKKNLNNLRKQSVQKGDRVIDNVGKPATVYESGGYYTEVIYDDFPDMLMSLAPYQINLMPEDYVYNSPEESENTIQYVDIYRGLVDYDNEFDVTTEEGLFQFLDSFDGLGIHWSDNKSVAKKFALENNYTDDLYRIGIILQGVVNHLDIQNTYRGDPFEEMLEGEDEITLLKGSNIELERAEIYQISSGKLLNTISLNGITKQADYNSDKWDLYPVDWSMVSDRPIDSKYEKFVLDLTNQQGYFWDGQKQNKAVTDDWETLHHIHVINALKDTLGFDTRDDNEAWGKDPRAGENIVAGNNDFLGLEFYSDKELPDERDIEWLKQLFPEEDHFIWNSEYIDVDLIKTANELSIGDKVLISIINTEPYDNLNLYDGFEGYIKDFRNDVLFGGEGVVIEFENGMNPKFLPFSKLRLTKITGIKNFIFVIAPDGRIAKDYGVQGWNGHNDLARSLGAEYINDQEVNESGFARGVYYKKELTIIPEVNPGEDIPIFTPGQLQSISEIIQEIGMDNLYEVEIEDNSGLYSLDNFIKTASDDTYIEEAKKLLEEKLDDLSEEYIEYYTLLALTKGKDTTLEDIHDAWAMIEEGDHEALVPFDELDEETKELDRPYMEAVHEVAEEVNKIKTASADKDGVMVALRPPEEVVEKLRDLADDPDNLHVTLAYLGDTEGIDRDKLIDVVNDLADEQSEINLDGRVSGFGTFCNDDNHVLWASVDMPDIDDLRHYLAEVLEGDFVDDLDENYGFTPHMTLKYSNDPFKELPDMPEGLDQSFKWDLIVAYDGEWEKIANFKIADEQIMKWFQEYLDEAAKYLPDFVQNTPPESGEDKLVIVPDVQRAYFWKADDPYAHGNVLSALDLFELRSTIVGFYYPEEGLVEAISDYDPSEEDISFIKQVIPNANILQWGDQIIELQDIKESNKKGYLLTSYSDNCSKKDDNNETSRHTSGSLYLQNTKEENKENLRNFTFTNINRLSIFEFHKFADRTSVEQKADSIFNQGGVEYVTATPDPERQRTLWEFNVTSTSGKTYPLYGDTEMNNPSSWIDWFDVACSCDWGRWNYDRAPEYRHLERFPCSHALASEKWLAENGKNEQDKLVREMETGQQEMRFDQEPETGRRPRPGDVYRQQVGEPQARPPINRPPAQQPSLMGDPSTPGPPVSPTQVQPQQSQEEIQQQEDQELLAPPEPEVDKPLFRDQVLRPRKPLESMLKKDSIIDWQYAEVDYSVLSDSPIEDAVNKFVACGNHIKFWPFSGNPENVYEKDGEFLREPHHSDVVAILNYLEEEYPSIDIDEDDSRFEDMVMWGEGDPEGLIEIYIENDEFLHPLTLETIKNSMPRADFNMVKESEWWNT